MQKIAILGGTGFIGRHLIKKLEEEYEVVILSRSPEKHKDLEKGQVVVVKADYNDPAALATVFSTADGVVNLIGESVASRWTAKEKQKIYNSRVHNSRLLVQAFHLATKKPSFLIQGSGISVYGNSAENQDATFTEYSPLVNDGFLSKVGVDNEKAVKELEGSTRVVYIRTGIVLDRDEGALPKMTLPFKFFIGGPLGTGNQWSSWIHIKDEVRAIKFLAENKVEGAFNLTAPNPVTNGQMASAIGKVLVKPSVIHTPAFVLKLMLGEMAEELLLNGLSVTPRRLMDAGFKFDYNTIKDALIHIYKPHKP